ncbi:loricrin-like [Camellia sinensis]|uniref:loricrin-like n=1 Tax=Camellia sinensis TaxID=4442 RepID=UPI0010362179|nr:loricrin-like [Camellia sinensis]
MFKEEAKRRFDRSFNPINLDYIFEGVDPINLVSDDDDGGGGDSDGDGSDGNDAGGTYRYQARRDDGDGGDASHGDGGGDSGGGNIGNDGNDGGGTHRYQARRTSQRSTPIPTPTQSDISGGLAPFDGGGDDGDGGGDSHGGGSGGDTSFVGGGDCDGTSFGVRSEDSLEDLDYAMLEGIIMLENLLHLHWRIWIM